MSNISAQEVNQLRQATGAGLMACKKALVEAEGNMEKATELLKAKGEAKAADRSDRTTGEGTIGVYLHQTKKVAASVALLCETDFVARNEEFEDVAKKIAMQVAAMNPLYATPDEIAEEEITKLKAEWKEEMASEGKPEDVLEKILEGKLDKYFEENTLLKQKFFMDDSKTIEQLITELNAKVGENVQLGKISRMAI